MTDAATPVLLEVRDLHAGYGALDVLRGVDLQVRAGELVAVLGPNGAGKSTLLRTISRYESTLRSGAISFDGHDLTRATTERTVQLGCLHVPEGRQLFSELTVDDNLRLGAFSTDRARLTHGLADVYDRFPALATRKRQIAFTLSGGEQQMLAIGRALMAKPKLLMLDEPSMGLAPAVADTIFERISQIHREDGVTILLVEQRVAEALELSDHGYVLETGRMVLDGTYETLLADDRVRRSYLGLTEA